MTGPTTATPPLPSKAVLFAAFAALILLRLPNVLLHGRFFGEEGTYFLAYAWHMPWRDALLHPLGGYLNIVATGSTLLAKLLVTRGGLPLELAPYVTILVALALQLCPALLVLISRDAWLQPRLARPAALLLIATNPLTEEVWLHSLHSQFHLTLCAAIILATAAPGVCFPHGEAGRCRTCFSETETEPNSGFAEIFRLFLLLLAPLCGPAAIVLLPFFGLRAVVDRNRAHWAQFGVLALGSAIQMLLFYAPTDVRSHHAGPDVLAAILATRHVALPLLGPLAASAMGQGVVDTLRSGGTPWLPIALCLGWFGTLIFAARHSWRGGALWLIVPALALASVSYFGAIATGSALLSPTFGERYTYVPQVMIGLGLIALAASGAKRDARLFGGLAGLMILIGLLTFTSPNPSLSNGPDWKGEVALWRKNPAHRLALWPEGWSANLSPEQQGCTATSGAVSDYCDAAWAAQERSDLAQMPR